MWVANTETFLMADRAKVAEVGRDPRALKVLPLLLIFLGETDEEAEEKYAYWRSKGDGEVALAFAGGFTGVDWSQWGEDEEIILEEGTTGRAFLDNYKRAAPHIGKWCAWLH
jgi:alkanesulfonate monooxygenase SsuD/methylene tetrahydromethanopterin reductase-like flavin-dependent oxidoreductase (luciferase family)